MGQTRLSVTVIHVEENLSSSQHLVEDSVKHFIDIEQNKVVCKGSMDIKTLLENICIQMHF